MARTPDGELSSVMRELPLVSIVTPSLNQGQFIEETILSVLNQDYPNIEYIVVDGGSTDQSIDIIKRYSEHIAYWISEPDDGISDAFNKGIRASKGDIIGIVNVGDKYTEEAIRAATLALLGNPDYDFVYGDLIYIDAEHKLKHLIKGDRNYLDKIHYTMAINHATVFVKRKAYETYGLFDISYKITMDYEFLLRITKLGKKGIYIEKTLAQMAQGGISYARFYKNYQEVCRASIQYGYNPLKAYARLYLKGLRGLIRVTLEYLGLIFVIKLLRIVFWNVRYMKNS